MRSNKLITTSLATVMAAGLAFGLTACGSEAGAAETPTAPAAVAAVEAPEAEEAVENDVVEDLLYVLDVITENLEWGDTTWEQIMLADDVPSPEMKYGLLVVPFFPSDATARHTRTVSINSGNFVVEITSAETGIVWQIDQDGNISQAR